MVPKGYVHTFSLWILPIVTRDGLCIELVGLFRFGLEDR